MIHKFNQFKINEEKQENEVLIATNESSWSWEYDSRRIKASLYLKKNNGDLRLELIETHHKTGIGAGKTTSVRFDGNVGTIFKPALSEIKSILAKYKFEKSRAGNGFNMNWVDASDDTEKALSVIIASNREGKIFKMYNNSDINSDDKTVSKTAKLAAIHKNLHKLTPSELDALFNKLKND